MTPSIKTTFTSVFKFFKLGTKTVHWYEIHLSLKNMLIVITLKLALIKKRQLIHVTEIQISGS